MGLSWSIPPAIKAVSLLFVTAILANACTREPVLKIGVIAYAYDKRYDIEGFSTDKAAQLAARDIDSHAAIRVVLDTLYVSEAPEESVDAVRYLANRKGVAAIVGPSMSKQAIPSGEAAERARILLISSVSSNPDTTKGRSWVFRMCYLDPVQASAQVRFALDTLGANSFSLVYFESDPSSAAQTATIESELAARSRALRVALPLAPDDPSFAATIARSGPWRDEVVFLPDSNDFSVKAAAALRAAGFRGVFIGGDGWDRERVRANPDFEGSYMTTNYWSGQTSPGNAAFVAAYTAFAGRSPGDTAALTYDAIGMLAVAALRTGRVDSEGLRKGLLDGVAYQGISGAIDFHGSGDPIRELVFLKFSRGEILFGGMK